MSSIRDSAMHESSGRSAPVDVFGPRSALRQAMLEEPASISGGGLRLPGLHRRSHQFSAQMCKLRNSTHTASGALGALQPVIKYVVLGSRRPQNIYRESRMGAIPGDHA